MRSMISKAGLGLICLVAAPASLAAAEGTFTCAFTDVYECVDVKGCHRVSLDFANLAPVLKFDFDKKVMTSDDIGSEPREIKLENMVEQDGVILFTALDRIRSLRGPSRWGNLDQDRQDPRRNW